MVIADAAFEAVGLHVGSERTDAFVAGLSREADALASEGMGHRYRVAVDRVLKGLSLFDLADLVESLGLGAVTVHADRDAAGAEKALGDVLRHLLRRRLIDAMRISDGLPAFWSWAPSKIASLCAPDGGSWAEGSCPVHS
jgi:hypothetical protein